MHNPSDHDSRSPPDSPNPGGVVTRAPIASQDNTAQPSLTSGFGAVLEKERDLQAATEDSLGHASGSRSSELDRVLREQLSRLAANIALLEQRYEALPNPARFGNWHERQAHLAPRPAVPTGKREFLPALIAGHTRLLTAIDALIGCAPDGQRGELILTEVGRNHEQMARRLTAVLKEGEIVARLVKADAESSANAAMPAQENWENEGGPVSATPPASGSANREEPTGRA